MWRDSSRHRWQAGLTAVGIMLGVAVIVAVDLASQSAHRGLRISSDAALGRAATHTVEAGDRGVPLEALASLRKVPHVSVSPVVTGAATVKNPNGDHQASMTVLGFDPLAGPALPFTDNAGAGVDAGRSDDSRPDSGQGARNVTTLIGNELAAVLSVRMAMRLGLSVGDPLEVIAGGRASTVSLVATVDDGGGAPSQSRSGETGRPSSQSSRESSPTSSQESSGISSARSSVIDEYLLVDVVAAMRLFGAEGRLTRIDLVIPPGRFDVVAAVRRVLPAGTELIDSQSQASTRREMTRGFETNLKMLSLLSLVVGALLIFSAMSFTVQRREALFAHLRTLGLTRGEVFGAVIAEAGILGAVSTFLGIGLGWLLGTQLVTLVTRTMSDLYFVTEVRDVSLSGTIIAIALGIGVCGTVLAAAWPAWRACNTPPRIAGRRRTAPLVVGRLSRRFAAVGISCIAAGLLFVTLDLRYGVDSGSEREVASDLASGGNGATQTAPAASSSPLSPSLPPGPNAAHAGLWRGYVALALVLAGFGFLTLPVATGTVALFRAATRRMTARAAAATKAPGRARGVAVVARIALTGVDVGVGRTGVALAAFLVALATTVGVTVMVGSFRVSVETWLGSTLQATYYITRGSREAPALPDALAESIESLASVEAVGRIRWTRVRGEQREVQILALTVAGPQALQRAKQRYPLLATSGGDIWSTFVAGEGVFVSEPFSNKTGVTVGSLVRLRGDTESLARPVLGVFRDYRTERGFVLMSRELFDDYWTDPGFTGLGVYAEPSDSGEASIRRLLPPSAELAENRALLDRSLAIFDRTFVVTEVLRALTAIVAFLATLGALMALELDRVRERAVLRALGLTRGQTAWLIQLEGLLQGLVVGVLAVPCGVLLGWVLIEVINRRSFGWTMDLVVPWSVGPAALLTALVAAGLAGIYPALVSARTAPGERLRDE